MAATTINKKVVTWAHRKLHHKVGRGECWDLADQALRSAGARSSTTTGRNDDYVWGKPLRIEQVTPGDVIQFRDWTVTTTTVTDVKFADGSGYRDTNEVVAHRPHHTGIVASVDHLGGTGVVEVYEQHVKPGGKHVQLHEVATKANPPVTKQTSKMMKDASGKMRMATVSTVQTVTVSGRMWAYRPQAR